MRGRLRARYLAECYRCLGDARVEVDTDLTALLSPRGAGVRPQPDEEELGPEELDREFYSGDRIVLDGIVREHLLVEAPMQPLCAPDCAGIPVPEHVKPPADVFGPEGEGRIDPRLLPLMKLAGKGEPHKE